MHLDFCCNIKIVWSQFGLNVMKVWIHPYWFSEKFRIQLKTLSLTYVAYIDRLIYQSH